MDILNGAIDSLISSSNREDWTPVALNVADATVTISKEKVRSCHGFIFQFIVFCDASFSLREQINPLKINVCLFVMFVRPGWRRSAGGVPSSFPVVYGRRPRCAHICLCHGCWRSSFWLSCVLVWAQRWKCVRGRTGSLYGESPKVKKEDTAYSLTHTHPL